MSGVTSACIDLLKSLPLITDVGWLTWNPSPISKLPFWSVEVNGICAPSNATTSFALIGTAPLKGVAVFISVPVPINSNEWELVNILLILLNDTFSPPNNSYGINVVKVTVVSPVFVGSVAASTA